MKALGENTIMSAASCRDAALIAAIIKMQILHFKPHLNNLKTTIRQSINRSKLIHILVYVPKFPYF